MHSIVKSMWTPDHHTYMDLVGHPIPKLWSVEMAHCKAKIAFTLLGRLPQDFGMCMWEFVPGLVHNCHSISFQRYSSTPYMSCFVHRGSLYWNKNHLVLHVGILLVCSCLTLETHVMKSRHTVQVLMSFLEAI